MPLQGFRANTLQSVNGDEYYSPQNVVDMIVPYVMRGGHKRIWCPFDKGDSNFVKTFKGLGLEVVNGHIETGQDFFGYQTPQGEIVVSNPPFSRRDDVLKHLYELNVPFAVTLYLNGLFDSKGRREMFKRYGVELLIPDGRMKFFRPGTKLLNAPNTQTVYVCHKLLDKQIEFSDFKF